MRLLVLLSFLLFPVWANEPPNQNSEIKITTETTYSDFVSLLCAELEKGSIYVKIKKDDKNSIQYIDSQDWSYKHINYKADSPSRYIHNIDEIYVIEIQYSDNIYSIGSKKFTKKEFSDFLNKNFSDKKIAFTLRLRKDFILSKNWEIIKFLFKKSENRIVFLQ